MLFYVRMIRGTLKSHIKCDIDIIFFCFFDELTVFFQCTQFCMNRLMTSFVAADRPGRSWFPRFRGDAVVLSLAVYLSNRMDGWQVQHVEAHGCHTRKKPHNIL